VLFTMHRDGKPVDAVAQISKQAYVYVFDRVTGKPLFPVHEHPYPKSEVPGEVTSPTQPMPDAPDPFARQKLTEDLLTTRTPEAHEWAVNEFRKMRSNGQFIPFRVGQLTIVYPGFDGGGEWSGAAIDPATDVLYVGSSQMANVGALVAAAKGTTQGTEIYQNLCAMCHGIERKGSPPAFPELLGVFNHLSEQEVTDRIKNGKGRMPSFPFLDDRAITALLGYLRTEPEQTAAASSQGPAEYVFTGYRQFLDPDGYPATATPWGTLNAIDLKTGKYLWKIPLGEYPELAEKGMKNTGSELYGGPIVTAGGVVFIGATVFDRKFHAFDSSTGQLLWETTLPFAGEATPSTYMVDGRQYVVIAASGGMNRNPKGPIGGDYIAFALPK